MQENFKVKNYCEIPVTNIGHSRSIANFLFIAVLDILYLIVILTLPFYLYIYADISGPIRTSWYFNYVFIYALILCPITILIFYILQVMKNTFFKKYALFSFIFNITIIAYTLNLYTSIFISSQSSRNKQEQANRMMIYSVDDNERKTVELVKSRIDVFGKNNKRLPTSLDEDSENLNVVFESTYYKATPVNYVKKSETEYSLCANFKENISDAKFDSLRNEYKHEEIFDNVYKHKNGYQCFDFKSII